MAICAVKREILLIKRALRKVKVWPTKKGKKLWESKDSTMVHLRLRIVQIYIYASHGVKFF